MRNYLFWIALNWYYLQIQVHYITTFVVKFGIHNRKVDKKVFATFHKENLKSLRMKAYIFYLRISLIHFTQNYVYSKVVEI